MMTTIRLTERVYLLKDRFDCYSNLILGDEKALLFDTGCGVDDLKSSVEKITKLPLLVILSHGHFDHIGGSRQFETAYLSSKDRNILDDYNEALLNRWVFDMCKENQAPIYFGTNGWKQIRELDFRSFDLGNLKGEIIELPGHSYGSVGVYFPQLKLLLSGDALSPVMCLIFQNHGTKEEQLQTLKKAADLSFEYYLTSHSKKLMPKHLLSRMESCIQRSAGKRFHQYKYPKPPYSEGWFYFDSMEDEPVGLIVETKE